MSARQKMPAVHGLPSGQSGSAGGDGQVLCDTQATTAIPTIARNGRRGGRKDRDTHYRSAPVDISLANAQTPKGRGDRASGAPFPASGRRAMYTAQSENGMPDAAIAGHVESETQQGLAGSGIDHEPVDDRNFSVNPAQSAKDRRDERRNARDGRIYQEMRARRGNVGNVSAPRELNPAILLIQSLHREHRAIQAARGDMDRRIKGFQRMSAARRYVMAGIPMPVGKFPNVTSEDETTVARTYPRLFVLQSSIEAQRTECQKELLAAAKSLPILEWAASVKGLGLASVAAIVGEAGDIGSYATVSRLWKRMGLAVINGKSQRKSKDNAEEQGYNPRRRSEMHVIGDCLVRAGGDYKTLYNEHKAMQLEREGISKLHAHRRALRYIEKRLLRELWRAWRRAMLKAPSITQSPVAESLDGHRASGNHTTGAIQGGGLHGDGNQAHGAPAAPIPRKRALRAYREQQSDTALPEAAD